MTRPRIVSASVRQRLLNLARSDRRPFGELLQYFAMERFLYRLSESAHADRFILKGALMLQAWHSPTIRPTMDIDLLGRTSSAEAELAQQLRDILTVPVEPDGLAFEADSIRTERITEGADYEGIRVRFPGALGTARVRMQVDIGFGDVVYPEPVATELPTVLEFPAPLLLCYSREAAIAEKLQASVKLGMLNSRMKDFYDIWLLSRQFDFDGRELAEAIRRTFRRRGTALPSELEALSGPFVADKQTLWTAFRSRLRQEHLPVSFAEVAAALSSFLSPVVAALVAGEPAPHHWKAPGPWA